MTATLPTTPRTTSGVTNGRYEIADCRVEDLVIPLGQPGFRSREQRVIRRA